MCSMRFASGRDIWETLLTKKVRTWSLILVFCSPNHRPRLLELLNTVLSQFLLNIIFSRSGYSCWIGSFSRYEAVRIRLEEPRGHLPTLEMLFFIINLWSLNELPVPFSKETTKQTYNLCVFSSRGELPHLCLGLHYCCFVIVIQIVIIVIIINRTHCSVLQ